MSIACKKCELPLRPTQKFCPRCGAENDWKPDAAGSEEASPALATSENSEPTVVARVCSPDEYYAEGVAYFRGTGGTQDHSRAIASFMNAADAGHAGAMYAVGVMYLRGLGIVANSGTAAIYLKKSETAGFAQAGSLLAVLSAGEDAAKFPVLPIPMAPAPAKSKVEDAKSSSESEEVTVGMGSKSKSLKLIIAGAVVLLIIGIGGYGYNSYRQEVAKESERQERAASEQKAQALKAEEESRQQEAKRKEETALAEQRAKLEAQETELNAKAEALRQQEQQRAEVPPPLAPSSSAAQNTAAATDLPKRIAATLSVYAVGRAKPIVGELLDASKAGSEERIHAAVEQLRAMPTPARGDRQLARATNTLGLRAVQTQAYPDAARLFCDALAADPADQEILNNLAYALEKGNRLGEAKTAALATLTLAPRRASAWGNLGTILAAEGKEDTAVAALLLAYRFSQNPQKTLEYLDKVLAENPTPAVSAAIVRTQRVLRK